MRYQNTRRDIQTLELWESFMTERTENFRSDNAGRREKKLFRAVPKKTKQIQSTMRKY